MFKSFSLKIKIIYVATILLTALSILFGILTITWKAVGGTATLSELFHDMDKIVFQLEHRGKESVGTFVNFTKFSYVMGIISIITGLLFLLAFYKIVLDVHTFNWNKNIYYLFGISFLIFTLTMIAFSFANCLNSISWLEKNFWHKLGMKSPDLLTLNVGIAHLLDDHNTWADNIHK